MRIVFLASLLVMGCSSKTKSAPKPEALVEATTAPLSTANAPDLDSARAALLRHGELVFDPSRHVGCEAQTLSGYVELLEREGAQGDIHSLELTCRATRDESFLIDPEVGADDHWFCRYDAHSSDKEGVSPWDYSLQFLIRKSTGELDRQHFACPGQP